MNDQSFVKALDTKCYLNNNFARLRFSQRLARLLDGVVEEVAGGHELGHDVHLVMVLKSLNQLEDVLALRLSAFLHDFELLEYLVIINESACYCIFIHNLKGNLDVRESVDGEDDCAE